MKKIIRSLSFLLVVITMFVPITVNAQDAETSFLEDVFAEPSLNMESMQLELQTIEIKGVKDWSGDLAIIYDKTVDATAVTDGVKNLYTKDQDQWIKELIKTYESLASDFEKKIASLEKEMSVPHVREALGKVNEYISLLKSEPLLTIDMELQQANMLSQSFADGFKSDFATYDASLRNKVVAVERVKNIDLQQLIDRLNAAKIDYEDQVKKDIEAKVSTELQQKFTDMIASHSGLSFRRVGSNDKELFVVLTFKHISDIHSGFNVSDATDESMLSEDQKLAFDSIKHDYILTHQEEPEIKAAAQYLLDIVSKSQKMMTITLETEGQRLLQSFNGQIDTLIKEKESDPQNLYGPQINEAMNALRQGMTEYQQKSSKIKDDTDQVDKVLALVDTYDEQVLKFAQGSMSKEALEAEFQQYKVLSASFENPIPVEIRMTVEGKYVIKYLANGQVDTKLNYFYNMQSSGDSAMRLYSEEHSFLGFYEPAGISGKSVKTGFYLYGLLLLILFFVKRDWFKNLIVLNVLLLISFIVIYPLAWVVGASLNSSTSLGSVGISPFPKQLTLIQYERLFLTTDYGKWFLNSFKIAVSNMLITVSLAVMAAYIFSRFKFKGKKIGLMTLLIIQIFPSFSAMVAIYTLLANVKFLAFLTGETSLVNTHLGLILVYCAGQIPYNTWLVKGYFDTLPMSMDEAARIDGASNMQAFLKIILPLGRPIIAFVAVTSFMAPWMDFILPRLLLKSTEKKTLAVGLFEMINGQSNNNFTMFAAGAVLVAVPITLLYAYFQKYIVKGLASGAVKG